jgi:hypothetical protein
VADKTETIYQLKVTLKGIKPIIWRRFQVRSDISFYELNLTLQVVMGWWHSHLHQFEVDGLIITDYDTLVAWGEEGVPVDEAQLDQYVNEEGQRFSYEYDFGDSWRHEIQLEEIVPAEPDSRYPRCLAGARACPPEDVGDIGGYAYYLDALADPMHEEHHMYLEWRGEFDPEAFDVEEVNRELREGIRWEGDLVMAPLVSTREFTRPALWFWDGIPEHIQALMLGSAWCRQCRSVTTLVDFKGNIQRGDLVLRGHCVYCGGPAARVIESE